MNLFFIQLAGYGTALGVIRSLNSMGKLAHAVSYLFVKTKANQ